LFSIKISNGKLLKIDFKDDEEKRVFEKLFYWLFEIEIEL